MRKLLIAAVVLVMTGFANSSLAVERCEGEDKMKWVDCLGFLNYEGGHFYFGRVKKGKSEGFGTYYFNDGTYYVGSFKNDEFHGVGTMTLKTERNTLVSGTTASVMVKVFTLIKMEISS